MNRATLLVGTLAWCAGCASVRALQPVPAAQPERGARPPAEDDGALARSHQGRPLRWSTHGQGARRVLLVGGIHGDEREGAEVARLLPAALAAEAGAHERVTLVVIDDLNPDGSAAGTRGNAHGVDLNRNFPAPSFDAARTHGPEPLSEPESRALAELVSGWRPELVLVCHAWRAAEFVNFDGPALALAQRFARTSGLELRPSDELAPTPGSFGSWAGTTLGIPVLTLEFRRGRSAESAWELVRPALLEALLAP